MRNLMQNNRGNTLAYVMMVMVVVFIIVSVIMSMTMTNIREASTQEKTLEAYYVARSGAELAYQALLTTEPSKLQNISNLSDPTTFKGKSDLVLNDNGRDFGNGTADITVTSSGSGNDQVIIIKSVGTLKNFDVSKTVYLEFYLNYSINPTISWSDEDPTP